MGSLNKEVIVLGDVHCDFPALNCFVNRKRPAVVLQCGDFGYWPRLVEAKCGRHAAKPCVPRVGDTKLYFCDGNHEDHDALDALVDRQVYPNVFHMPRGSTMTLDDGRVVLFMGGAYSIDRSWRDEVLCKDLPRKARREAVVQCGWFPQEVLTWTTWDGMPRLPRVDVVVSHTCPNEFFMKSDDRSRMTDISREVLSEVLRVYHPPLWYFGHWHEYKTGYDKGCRWTALNMMRESMAFARLPH